jgi:hypothetical protein
VLRVRVRVCVGVVVVRVVFGSWVVRRRALGLVVF